MHFCHSYGGWAGSQASWEVQRLSRGQARSAAGSHPTASNSPQRGLALAIAMIPVARDSFMLSRRVGTYF